MPKVEALLSALKHADPSAEVFVSIHGSLQMGIAQYTLLICSENEPVQTIGTFTKAVPGDIKSND
jgi:hypothetical protein